MDTGEIILREADNLFCQFGVKSVTMDDIAKHLGMSKKTIYLHFKDKNELVQKLIEITIGEQKCIINNMEESADNAVDEIFSAVANIQTLLSKMNPLLFYDLQKYYPAAWDVFHNFRNNFLFDCIGKNLKRGIQEGLYREEINIRILARMRVEQIGVVFNSFAFPPTHFNLSEVMTVITEHFLYGICTIKGHKLTNKYKHINEED